MSMRWFKMINLFIVLQVFLKHFSDTFPSFAPKKRAKRIRKFSTCVDMLFVWQYLHRRTMTCVNFGRSQIRIQVDAHFSLFGHSTQVDTSWLQVNCICVKFTAFCDLCELANRSVCPPSASPYTRSGFANLHRFSWLVILVWSVLLALVNASNHILTVS